MADTHKGLIAWFARNSVAANLLMLSSGGFARLVPVALANIPARRVVRNRDRLDCGCLVMGKIEYGLLGLLSRG